MSSHPLKTVLVADDNDDIRELVRVTLSGRYTVFQASDGEEAVAQARARMPDLLLLDLAMPGMDGIAVSHAIKNDPATAGIKIMMLTARQQETLQQPGSQPKADAYMTKPFRPRDLLERIERLLA